MFGAPDDRNLARSPNPHLGFDAGVHYCLGARLGRVEVAAVLRALADRLPDMAPVRRARFVMRGWSGLHLHRA